MSTLDSKTYDLLNDCLHCVLQVARTLMITSIPREISDPGLITKHFQYKPTPVFHQSDQLRNLILQHFHPPFAPFPSEAYPSCTVTDVRFGFNVHRLMRLDSERYSQRGVAGASECVDTLVPEVRCVFQAEGNERKAVFCHEGSKGREDLNQDSSVRTDILLRHLRL